MENLVGYDDWVLYEHDPVMGRTVWIRDNGDGTMTARTDYDVTKTLDANKAALASAAPGWKGDWHRVASIPLGLLHNPELGLMDAARDGDRGYLRKILNDSDYRHLRTKEGKL
jgi:hypothetical protein